MKEKLFMKTELYSDSVELTQPLRLTSGFCVSTHEGTWNSNGVKQKVRVIVFECCTKSDRGVTPQFSESSIEEFERVFDKTAYLQTKNTLRIHGYTRLSQPRLPNSFPIPIVNHYAIVAEYLPTLYDKIQETKNSGGLDGYTIVNFAKGIIAGLRDMRSHPQKSAVSCLSSLDFYIDSEGNAKVGKVFDLEKHRHARVGEQINNYMAPEEMRCEPNAMNTGDIYNFAMLLWEMLTGHMPWENLTYGCIFNYIAHENKKEKLPPETAAAWNSADILSGKTKILFEALNNLMEACRNNISTQPNRGRPTLDEIEQILDTLSYKEHEALEILLSEYEQTKNPEIPPRFLALYHTVSPKSPGYKEASFKIASFLYANKKTIIEQEVEYGTQEEQATVNFYENIFEIALFSEQQNLIDRIFDNITFLPFENNSVKSPELTDIKLDINTFVKLVRLMNTLLPKNSTLENRKPAKTDEEIKLLLVDIFAKGDPDLIDGTCNTLLGFSNTYFKKVALDAETFFNIGVIIAAMRPENIAIKTYYEKALIKKICSENLQQRENTFYKSKFNETELQLPAQFLTQYISSNNIFQKIQQRYPKYNLDDKKLFDLKFILMQEPACSSEPNFKLAIKLLNFGNQCNWDLTEDNEDFLIESKFGNQGVFTPDKKKEFETKIIENTPFPAEYISFCYKNKAFDNDEKILSAALPPFAMQIILADLAHIKNAVKNLMKRLYEEYPEHASELIDIVKDVNTPQVHRQLNKKMQELVPSYNYEAPPPLRITILTLHALLHGKNISSTQQHWNYLCNDVINYRKSIAQEVLNAVESLKLELGITPMHSIEQIQNIIEPGFR